MNFPPPLPSKTSSYVRTWDVMFLNTFVVLFFFCFQNYCCVLVLFVVCLASRVWWLLRRQVGKFMEYGGVLRTATQTKAGSPMLKIAAYITVVERTPPLRECMRPKAYGRHAASFCKIQP